MTYFVAQQSIVRKIWGNSDTILLVFAGASAEFALNKAVDWLYFTGRLPKDPLGRLFSTVSYAREIVFSEEIKAKQAIKNINSIHAAVENKRGKQIPNWAYKDVLYMLIDYSIRSFEILEHKLTISEKEDVLNVFVKVGTEMGIENLPKTYSHFQLERQKHLKQNLKYSLLTKDLYQQYRKHLGVFRYQLLMESQSLLLPDYARNLLSLRKVKLLKPAIKLYKICRKIKADGFLKAIILPAEYHTQIKSLNNIHQ